MRFWKRARSLPEITPHESFRIMEFELGDGSKGWEVQRKRVSEWESLYCGYFSTLEDAIQSHNRDVSYQLRRTIVSQEEVK